MTNKTITLLAALTLAVCLTGCGKDSDEYAEVCVDRSTNTRVSDDRCRDIDREDNDGGSNMMWAWLYMSSMNQNHAQLPAVGSRLPAHVRTTYDYPSRGSIYSKTPARGGEVSNVKSSSTKVGGSTSGGSSRSGYKGSSGSKGGTTGGRVSGGRAGK
ncbi:hypothetical protein VVR12_01695 [Rothia sp. LK2588]|uniref:hypothetical protein n=1 Tax=Rothia sp. LK2588 TaxID=3114369 RepID=UPI0034CF99A5